MLTKKDFKAVAEIIRKRKNRCELDRHLQAGFGVDAIKCDLADYFATQNPRFDRDKFMQACGLTE